MKFQCVLCLSTYNVENVRLGEGIECPNCGKKIVVPKKSFDRGRVIGGDFVIDRVLGTGGMGTVYLARQISLERDVALKVLARKFSTDPKFRMEFQREARAASRLTHTNLVQAYAFGEDGGDLFLAMEYVEGVTLGDRLDNETRLMIDEALNIIQQVAEGLDFAWTQEQLIHRDIKPDNIMLTTDGHVKLTDMGLARTVVELEKVTEVSGTPAYMNPEQFTKQPMDCRADIYSLGVCLYHAVTGQLPFDSPNVRELARQHIQDRMEFPDKTVDLPTDIKKLVRKMMAKNREDRYDDHDNLLHDIYNTRLKVNGSGAHVPSVHTLSFNRYEFKNIKPQRKVKSKDSETQVSSTKQLPRRKIKPLSAVTSTITSSFTTLEGESSKNSFFINNLLALLAIITAVILVMMFGGDTESTYYQDTQKLLSKVGTELKTPEEILEATDAILSKEISGPMNKNDYAARNRLLEIKVRYLKQMQDLKEEEVKAALKKYDDYTKDTRLASAKQKKREEQLNNDLNRVKKQLDISRKSFKSAGTQSIKIFNPEQKTNSFAKAISDDIKVLELLWEEKQEEYRLEILKKFPTRNFESAKDFLDLKSQNYSGIYSRWFKQQKDFINSARKVWEYTLANLQVIKGVDIEITANETYVVDKVFPGSGEIEINGSFQKLNEIDPIYFLKIYKKICSLEGASAANGAAYAVALFNFNLAFEISPKDKRIKEYALTYLSQRKTQINRYVDSNDTDKAEEVARRTYLQCNKIEGLSTDFKTEMETIFGRDIFLNAEPEDN